MAQWATLVLRLQCSVMRRQVGFNCCQKCMEKENLGFLFQILLLSIIGGYGGNPEMSLYNDPYNSLNTASDYFAGSSNSEDAIFRFHEILASFETVADGGKQEEIMPIIRLPKYMTLPYLIM